MKEYGYVIQKATDEIVGFCFEDQIADGVLKRLHDEDPGHIYVPHRVYVSNEDKIGNKVYLISAGKVLVTPYAVCHDDYQFAKKQAMAIERVEHETTKIDFIPVLK